VLPTPKNIKLPESTAQKPPKENIIIMVNNQDVLVQGRRVGSVQSILRSNDPVIKSLGNELKQITINNAGNDPLETVTKRGVTIMGDKEIPYGLLKKIMVTCSLADYSNISLAVAMRAQEEAEQ
jgi:biopolymer transport protein ExbD